MCNCFGMNKKKEAKQEANQTLSSKVAFPKAAGQSTMMSPNHSSPSAIKTCELTEIFKIAAGETVQDVATSHGFELGSELGRGSYATVYKAKRLRDNQVMACKVMQYTAEHSHNMAAKNELFILERVCHPNIVKMYQHFMVDMDNQRFVFIFMQLGDDSLSVFMRQMDKKDEYLPEATCKRMSAQMISAVNHMHTKGIAHRDLKMSNVLLDKDTNCLVTDFGLSRVAFRPSKGGTVMSNKYCGTSK